MKRILRQSVLVILLYLVGKQLALLERQWQHNLLPDTYLGTYRSIYHAAMLLGYFDLGTGAIRHLVGFRHDKPRRAAFLGLVLTITTLIYAGVVACFCLLYVPLTTYVVPQSYDLLQYGWILFPLGYLIILNITLKAWLRGLGHVVSANLLHQLGLGLLLLANVGWCLSAEVSLHRFLFQSLLPFALLLLLYITYMAHLGVWQVRGWGGHFDAAFVRTFLHYTLFTLASSSIIRIMPRIDIIMVYMQCGPADTAYYDLAYFLAALVNIPLRVAKNTTEHTFATLFLHHDREALATLYQKVTLHQCVAVVLGVLLVHEQVPYQLANFPLQAVDKVYALFLILATAEIASSLLGTAQLLLVLSKHYKMGLLAPLIVLLGTVANYVMIGQLGPYGAAWATFGTLAVGGLATTFLAWYHLGIHPFTKQLGYLFPMVGLTLAVQQALPTLADPLYHSLFHGTVTLLTYGVLALATGIWDGQKGVCT